MDETETSTRKSGHSILNCMANSSGVSAPRELILIGGGHTHVLLLRELGKNPLRTVRLTLVSDVKDAPYSGMLPGHISGIYSRAEMQIDLPRLCNFAGARFIHAKVLGLDLARKQVLLPDNVAPVAADLVSINVGGTPSMEDVAGAESWAIPAKPVPELIRGWQRAVATAPGGMGPFHIVIVGGGAGGVELALAMHSQVGHKAAFTIIHGAAQLLPGHNSGVHRIMSRLLEKRGIATIMNARVVEVVADSVRLDDGRCLPADFAFWVTRIAPPAWLAQSGLDTTPDGFVRTGPTLQAINYSWIFAAGDVVAIEGQKLPKSGVFAVRMAKPLENNLRAYLSGNSLRNYKPQRRSLSLIGTADGRAIASYGCLAGRSVLFWHWKTWIDRRFMRQFQNLPVPFSSIP
ncbi:FAD-dependent oxidoreductase [Nitrosospira briensis]|uniref:FAD-dependent oxidoreductase n=1 Tax=Nitrosospira briensis TaxID=35799 RepID=UPI0008E1D05A|nr:FAD-dependent oxidoreductase [Nitrosospira briensis]SFO10388.1 selenide, water dikinase [Nitrosospira briensis]